MKILLIFFLLFTPVVFVFSQDFTESLKPFFDFVEKTRDYREGFKKSTGSNDFRYKSIRSDVNECLITRATNGQMAIEWITEPLEENINPEGVGFLWIAAMDITPEKYNFDVYLNNIRRFTVTSSEKYNWLVKSTDGGSLQFQTIERDQHGDAHGYMALWAPAAWLNPGQSQQIKIVGESAGSSTWIIVYKATDAASFLQQSVLLEKWLSLKARKEGNSYEVTIQVPGYSASRKLTYAAGSRKGTIIPVKKDNLGVGSLELPLKILGKPFSIQDSIDEIVSVPSFGSPGLSVKLLSSTILSIEQKQDKNQNIFIEADRIFAPATVENLKELAQSSLQNGEIYLMNSSHQDIAWMDSPEKCELERDTMLITPLLELASRDPYYRFDVEDALMLKEYIRRHPDKKALIRKMLEDGRLSCGSTFIQPYEEMYSGEALARQFYLGAKWLKDEFDYDARVYWNVDVPGRTLQMPQIMKKAGTDFLMMSRFEKGYYQWFGPDGSSVIAFSPGHYADAFTPLQKNFTDAAQYVATSANFWGKYQQKNSKAPVIPLLSDWDMSPAVDYSALIGKWESIREMNDGKGNPMSIDLPDIRITSGDEFFTSLSEQLTGFPSIRGERPAIWLYIHGPSHQKALKASREGDIILTQAEKFATVLSWINETFKDYPHDELNAAWEAKIFPDHGWGGKNGEITDHLFLEKFLFAKSQGEKIRDRSLREISSKIKVVPEKGRPLVVFNSLSWMRSDVVTAWLKFDPGKAKGIVLKDLEGREIPVQIVERESYQDGSLRSAKICFIAERVPSIGYKTFYYNPGPEETGSDLESQSAIESTFYRLELADGGVRSIYDKELQKELINPGKFRAGEIFTMHSVGNGAGEFADVQQPDMEGFDRTGNYTTHWELKENGPVYTAYQMRQPIRNAVVRQEVVVFHDLKRIDFNTDILNWEGILFREYRFALPLNMENAQVAYEVPYGVLEVGRDELDGNAGERYIYPCRDTRPRGIQNWIGAYDKDLSVILSSSVAAADYLDPTDNPVSYPVIQPVLFASRQSCHGEGNDYLQTGSHSFHFSLSSSYPDWRNGYKSGIQANESLMAMVPSGSMQDADLPEEKSFFEIDAPNLMITTLKKAEDKPETVFRLVEIEGRDTDAGWKAFISVDDLEKVNLIEESMDGAKNLKNQKIRIGHHSIETFRLK